MTSALSAASSRAASGRNRITSRGSASPRSTGYRERRREPAAPDAGSRLRRRPRCREAVRGEGQAVPILVRRIAATLELPCTILPPIRQPRTTTIKPGELERAVTLLGNKVGDDGAILVLLDADDDLACALAPALLTRARAARPDRRICVVLAVRAYEAWFVASATSLRGRPGLPDSLAPPPDAEAICDAKGWLGARMRSGYSPTIDQPALSSLFDLQLARVTTSFDKLVRDLTWLLTPTVSQV